MSVQKVPKFSQSLWLTLILILSHSLAAATETKFIQYDGFAMHQLKQSLQSKEPPKIRFLAYQQLLTAADKMLDQPVPSVMEKTFIPPSGDKHDYLSISRYWWPDPAKKDGLPWIRKDGITNPATQTNDVDRNKLGIMGNMVQVLSLAYYLSGHEPYAEKTATLLRTWFISPETKMNPHLRFAQSVPGNSAERRSGILDGRLIPKYVLDAIHILSKSNHWKNSDTQNMNAWFDAYFKWLTQSELGKQAATQTNNHGSWYYFQVASLAYYLDEQEVLTDTFERVKASYEYQFDANGSQPHELARTRSFFYSTFNLEAITDIALLADKVNQSFWDYRSKSGASLKLAIEFLMPAALGEEWKYKTKGIEPMFLVPVLIKFDQNAKHKISTAELHRIISHAKRPQKSSTTKDNHTTFKFANKTELLLALFEPEYISY